MAVDYPKPRPEDITALSAWLKQDWLVYHERVEAHRALRFHKQVGSEKETRTLKHESRVYSNTTNREIIDTVAIQTGNPPRVRINPAGSTSKAVERAKKQERWANLLPDALERQSGRSLRRPHVDNQHSAALGCYEFYVRRSKPYEALAAGKQKIEAYDPNTGYEDPETAAKALLAAQDESLMGARLPFGFRNIDTLAVFYEEDDDGPCRGVILEDKPMRMIFAERAERAQQNPKEGTPGTPSFTDNENPNEMVHTIRYYDRKWMAYLIDDKPEYIVEHNLTFFPLFFTEGIITGSPNRSEALQGVTWGFDDLERIFDDLITQNVDDAKRYRPTAVIVTPEGSLQMVAKGDAEQKPLILHPDPNNVIQLNPGQKPEDLWSGVRPTELSPMISLVQAIMSRSSLNPVATGTTIGADPAGYTLNTLINASQKRYEILLDNEARTWGLMVDAARLFIRDTLKEKVYLSVPMADPFKGGTEWLALGPDDIDETPAVVTIDAIGDQNKIATRQSLMQALGLGIISKDRVQREGFSIEDTEVENFQITVEAFAAQIAQVAWAEALRIVYGARTPIGQGPEGAVLDGGSSSGTPYQAQGDGAGGGQAAPVEAPTVGTATSAMAGGGNGVTEMAGVTQ